jgi:hypothetical protein
MPRKSSDIPEQEEERERIITVREDSIYGYTEVLDKICHRKEPVITKLLRRKPFEPGIYKIRDGRINRMTPERLEILSSEKVMWIKLTNDLAKQILGTNSEPLYGNYVRDLQMLLKRHENSFINHPIMFLHEIKYVPRAIQRSVDQFGVRS